MTTRHQRDLYLQRIYGISADDFDVLVADAGNRCPLCLKPFKGTPVVDHDHRTGIVRGVLCTFCNHRLIGRHRDPLVFERAAAYLANPPAVRTLGAVIVPKKRPKNGPKASTRASSRTTMDSRTTAQEAK